MSAPESNAPEEFVVTTIICAVAALVIVTLAPPMNALEGSLTVPTMLPVAIVVWAKRGDTVTSELQGHSQQGRFWELSTCKRCQESRTVQTNCLRQGPRNRH